MHKRLFGHRFSIQSFYSDLNQLVKRLIGLGAKIDATDDNGDSPLFEAAREGSFETVRVLIENGADINLMNKHNKTSLDLANENGDLRYKKSIKFNQCKTYTTIN